MDKPSMAGDAEALKPCPRCSGQAFVTINFGVWCQQDRCLTLPPRLDRAEAIAAWNTREASEHPAPVGSVDGERLTTRYELEWRNGGEWKRPGGGGFRDGLHRTQSLTDREEAFREMASENARWVDTAEHRIVEITERVIGHASDKGRHVITDSALATPSSEPIAAEPTVAIPKRLVDFLMGAGELEGCHFGEMERGYGHRGRFWWRALLAAAMRSASSSALPLTGSEPSADAIAATGKGEGA